MKKSGITAKQNNLYINQTRNTSTTNGGVNVEALPEPTTVMSNYGISLKSESKLRSCRNPSGALIAPDYEPVNSVLLNPDISQIIVDNPSKEINLKSLKKFKPLIPDYDSQNSRNVPLKYIEETDDAFDWYQTDDLYDPTASREIANETEVNILNIIYF